MVGAGPTVSTVTSPRRIRLKRAEAPSGASQPSQQPSLPHPLEASALPLSIAGNQRMSIVNYVQLIATVGITVATVMPRSCMEFITGKIYPFEPRELSPCH